MGRAAADDRSRGKSSCNANAAAPRAWQYNRQALQLFELLACNGNFLWEGVREGYLFLKRDIPPLSVPPRQAGSISNFFIKIEELLVLSLLPHADGCVIKKGAVVRNSVVLAEVTVGEGVHVENEVVDKWAKLVHKKEIVSPAEQPGYIRRNDTL